MGDLESIHPLSAPCSLYTQGSWPCTRHASLENRKSRVPTSSAGAPLPSIDDHLWLLSPVGSPRILPLLSYWAQLLVSLKSGTCKLICFGFFWNAADETSEPSTCLNGLVTQIYHPAVFQIKVAVHKTASSFRSWIKSSWAPPHQFMDVKQQCLTQQVTLYSVIRSILFWCLLLSRLSDIGFHGSMPL